MHDEKQRFSLRKLSVGLASVLIGVSFFEAGQTVKADTVNTQEKATSGVVQEESKQTGYNAHETNQNQEVAIKQNSQAENSASFDSANNTEANNLANQASVNKTQNSQTGQDNSQLNSQNEIIKQTKVDNTSNHTQINNNSQLASQNGQETSQNSVNEAQNKVQNVSSETNPQAVNKISQDLTKTQAFNLKATKQHVFAASLAESKVQTNLDLNTQTDPSKLSQSDFKNQHYTTAGWTSLDNNTKVAKKSSIEYAEAPSGEFDLSKTEKVLQPGLHLEAQVDKQDIKKGNQILVGSIVATNGKPNQNLIFAHYDDVAAGGNDCFINNQRIGNFYSVDRLDNEVDFMLNVDTDLDLAVDPTIKLDVAAKYNVTHLAPKPMPYHAGDPNNNIKGGKDLKNAVKDIGDTYYLVTPNNIYQTKIVADLTPTETHSLPGLNNKKDSMYNDTNQIGTEYSGVNYLSTISGTTLIGTYKVQSSANTLTDEFAVAPWFKVRYYPVLNTQVIYDSLPSDFAEGGPSADFLGINYKTYNKNMSQNELQKALAANTIGVSQQNDGSLIFAYKIDTDKFSKLGENYVKFIVNNSVDANITRKDQKDQLMQDTINYYRQRNFVPTDITILTPTNLKQGTESTSSVITVSDLDNQNLVNTMDHAVNGSNNQAEAYRTAYIHYVDDDNNEKTLSNDSIMGIRNQDATYNLNIPSGYALNNTNPGVNWHFDNDNTKVIYTFYDDQNQNSNNPIVIHLKHIKKTVTLDDPSEKMQLNQSRQRIIHYVYSDGEKALEDTVQTVNFTRSAIKDMVTGVLSNFTPWSANTNYGEVMVKHLTGYTPNEQVVESMQASPDTNIENYVVYSPNKQVINVKFVDDTTGQVLDTITKTGYTDADSGYSTKDDLNNYFSRGYDLVSDATNGSDLRFDSDDFEDNQNYTVHLKHGLSQKEITNQVTRTINYVNNQNQEIAPSVNNVITFKGTEVTDKVNGVKTINWNNNQQIFDYAKSPIVKGFTPDKYGIDQVVVNPDDSDLKYVVTYMPDTQYAKFNYIDDNSGDLLLADTMHGDSFTPINYQTDNEIKHLLNKGYVLVSDATKGQSLKFDDDKNIDQTYEIHVKHNVIEINRDHPGKPGQALVETNPNGAVYPENSDVVDKTVNRTINYLYANGKKANDAVHDSVNFTRTMMLDAVTGRVISDKWSGPEDFKEVTSPEHPGYMSNMASVINNGVTYKDSPIEVNVVYSADKQIMNVIYRDTTTGQILQNHALNGVSDEDSHYNTGDAIKQYLLDGYKLVSDQTEGQDLVFDHDDETNQTYYVDFSHNSHMYNPDKPNEKDKVKRDDYLANYKTVISYVDQNKHDLINKVIAQNSYIRDLTIDSVTGDIINKGDWKLNKGYDNVDNPVIKGYITHDMSVKPIDKQEDQTINVIYDKLGVIHLVDNNGHQIAADVTYTQDTQNPTKVLVMKLPGVNGYEQVAFSVDPSKDPLKDATVIYNAPGTVEIQYVDTDTDRILKTDKVNGFATHAINYEQKPVLDNFTDKGYVVSQNGFKGGKFTEGLSKVTVKLKHNLVTVDYTKPQNKGDKIPGTKRVMPDGVAASDLNYSVNRVITVIDPHTGTKDTMQKADIHRDAIVDAVTGEVSYKTWSNSSWDEFITPSVAGYTPSQNSVEKTIVTRETKHVAITITYKANPQTGKISYVDKDGNEIGKTDLTGVTDQEVAIKPVIPHGWVISEKQTIPKTVKATANGIPTVKILIEHGHVIVTPTDPKTPSDKMPDGDNYPEGVDESDLNRDITRTITVVDPHTGKKTIVQTAHLTRKATIDTVTGNVDYSDWTNSKWDKFIVPVVAGYTADTSDLSEVPVNIKTKNSVVTITYKADLQKGKISYVDQDGKEIANTPLSGVTDSKVDIKVSVPKGWEVVPDQDIPETVIATPHGIDPVMIKIRHKVIEVLPTDPKMPKDKMPDGDNYPEGVSDKDLNKEVTRIINLHLPSGDKSVKQVAKYTRKGLVDEVSGKVTYTDWVLTDNKAWDEYKVPMVDNYTASIANIPENKKPEKDETVDVYYTYNSYPNSEITTPTAPNNDDIKPNDSHNDDNHAQGSHEEQDKSIVNKGKVKKHVKRSHKKPAKTVSHKKTTAKIAEPVQTVKTAQNKVHTDNLANNVSYETSKMPITNVSTATHETQSKSNSQINSANDLANYSKKPIVSQNNLPQTGKNDVNGLAVVALGLALCSLSLAIETKKRKD